MNLQSSIVEKYKDENGQLTINGRRRIGKLLRNHFSILEISKFVGISTDMVREEIKSCPSNGKPYNATLAQKAWEERNPPQKNKSTMNEIIARMEKIEEEYKSKKMFVKTISDLLEELYNRKT